MTLKAPFFVGAPFALTASANAAVCWAGRPDILRMLTQLCRRFENRPDSSLDLMWANLGAGKSHALLHLKTLLAGVSGGGGCVAAYVEMPEQPRKFLDLYRQVVAALPLENVIRSLEGSSVSELSDLRRAAGVLAHGDSRERELAREWLLGGRPHLRELRAATGIGYKIESDSEACESLGGIVQGLAANGLRFVLLLDEFQRLGVSSARQREGILTYLRSIFSRNPVGFSVVMAVTTRVEKNALDLLPQELRTLLGMRRSVSLPEMNEEEALEFLLARFAHFRPKGYSGPHTAPIGDDALLALISHISGSDRARLTPRTLLQACAELFDEALDTGVSVIDQRTADRILAELRFEDF